MGAGSTPPVDPPTRLRIGDGQTEALRHETVPSVRRSGTVFSEKVELDPYPAVQNHERIQVFLTVLYQKTIVFMLGKPGFGMGPHRDSWMGKQLSAGLFQHPLWAPGTPYLTPSPPLFRNLNSTEQVRCIQVMHVIPTTMVQSASQIPFEHL